MATNKLLWSSKIIGVFFMMWFALFLQMHSFYVLLISWKVPIIVNN